MHKYNSSIMLTSVFAVVIFRAAFKTLVILAPLLGVTWLLGFFSIHSKSLVFQYLFAVVNSFQVTVTQLIKLCTKSKSWVGVGGGGLGVGGREEEIITENVHYKIEICGHLYLYALQKRYHPLEMVLLSLKG